MKRIILLNGASSSGKSTLAAAIDVPQAMREHLGITETLLRLSVGLEHPDDIIADLAQALEA